MEAVALLRKIQEKIRWDPQWVPTTSCPFAYCAMGCQVRRDANRPWIKRRREAIAHQRYMDASNYRVTVYRADGTATGPGA